MMLHSWFVTVKLAENVQDNYSLSNIIQFQMHFNINLKIHTIILDLREKYVDSSLFLKNNKDNLSTLG